MAKGKQLYTQQGYQELLDELQYLKIEKREKIKNDIAVARSFGDLSENAEYDEARNEQAKNEARIKELEALVENAVVLDESTIDTHVISLGSTVKVLNLNVNAEITYDLVGTSCNASFSRQKYFYIKSVSSKTKNSSISFYYINTKLRNGKSRR